MAPQFRNQCVDCGKEFWATLYHEEVCRGCIYYKLDCNCTTRPDYEIESLQGNYDKCPYCPEGVKEAWQIKCMRCWRAEKPFDPLPYYPASVRPRLVNPEPPVPQGRLTGPSTTAPLVPESSPRVAPQLMARHSLPPACTPEPTPAVPRSLPPALTIKPTVPAPRSLPPALWQHNLLLPPGDEGEYDDEFR